jgi:hypothetical protein
MAVTAVRVAGVVTAVDRGAGTNLRRVSGQGKYSLRPLGCSVGSGPRVPGPPRAVRGTRAFDRRWTVEKDAQESSAVRLR